MSSLDLGIIGNCEIAAVIDRFGRIVWSCFPRYDSDPAFCSLMKSDSRDEGFGFFDFESQDLAKTEQSCIENTAILSTTLTDKSGGAIRIIGYAHDLPDDHDRVIAPSELSIQSALEMPREERIRRYQEMIGVLRENDIHRWCERFIACLLDGRQQA